MPKLSTLLLLATLAPLAAACRSYNPGFEARMNPSVVLDTGAGGELGVSTDYGVVFLGRGQQSGEVDFTAWFQDGPTLETGIIEPLGPDLFLTRAEIELPSTPVTFQVPRPGTRVLVSGRRGGKVFKLDAEIASDPSIEGLLLKSSAALERLKAEHMGAGVYLKLEQDWKLLGLLSGRIELSAEAGTRSYHTVVGPASLWRLAAAARDLDQPKQLPKRGDILPR